MLERDGLIYAAFRIHLFLTWIRIRILGSRFGKSGSGSSDPPLEIVDPNPSTYFSIKVFFLLIIPEISNLIILLCRYLSTLLLVLFFKLKRKIHTAIIGKFVDVAGSKSRLS